MSFNRRSNDLAAGHLFTTTRRDGDGGINNDAAPFISCLTWLIIRRAKLVRLATNDARVSGSFIIIAARNEPILMVERVFSLQWNRGRALNSNGQLCLSRLRLAMAPACDYRDWLIRQRRRAWWRLSSKYQSWRILIRYLVSFRLGRSATQPTNYDLHVKLYDWRNNGILTMRRWRLVLLRRPHEDKMTASSSI